MYLHSAADRKARLSGETSRQPGMKILSISSAPGWFAQYKDDDGGALIEDPLVCWALAQDVIMKGEADVVGLTYDKETNLVQWANADNFLGYRHESELPAKEEK
jgi:hypothetical protein